MTDSDTDAAVPSRRELGAALQRIDNLAERAMETALELRSVRHVFERTVVSHTAESLGLDAVVDAGADERRTRALHQYRLHPTTTVTTFALLAEPAALRGFVENVRAQSPIVHHATLDGVELVLASDAVNVASLGVPVGARAVHAPPRPAIELPAAWESALLALRFSRPSAHDHGPYLAYEAVMFDSSVVGGYALLAQTLTARQLEANPEVRRLNRLVSDHGEEMLVWLEAVAATDSLRKAAALVHLHHNSLTYRVERAERHLGYSLTEPYGRNRLFLALVLRRLHETSRLMRSNEPDGP
jgi:hypothetical protein